MTEVNMEEMILSNLLNNENYICAMFHRFLKERIFQSLERNGVSIDT